MLLVVKINLSLQLIEDLGWFLFKIQSIPNFVDGIHHCERL